MIEEQDRRYRESLEADRLKEEKRIEAERLKVQEQEEKEVRVPNLNLNKMHSSMSAWCSHSTDHKPMRALVALTPCHVIIVVQCSDCAG